MKKYLQNFKIFTLALGLMLTASSANAITYFSRQTGNWNATSTWSLSTGGGIAGTLPVAGDIVIIERGFTVHVTANAACASLQVGSPGNSNSGAIDFTGAFSITVTGNSQFGGFGNTARTGTITFSNGSSLITGSLTIGNAGATPAAGIIDMTAGGTLSVGGAITVITVAGNTWTPGAGTLLLTATNTLPATIFTTFNDLEISAGTTTVSAAKTINSDLKLTGGTLAAGNFITMGSGGTPLITRSGGIITGTLQGTNDYDVTYTGSSMTTGPELSTTGLNDITVNLTAGQTLTLDQARTPDGDINLISGIFAAGNFLTMDAGGTPVINVSGGSMTGNIQANNGYDVVYTGNSKTTGGELSGTGLLVITVNLTAGQTLTLNQNRTPFDDLTITSGTFDLQAFTITSGSGGTLTINDGATLKIGGTNTFPSNYSGAFSNTSATVEYAGTNQTVASITGDSYTILILSGSGIKTLTNETVNELLSIQGTATTTGVSPTYLDAGTILEYKGSAAQTISNVEFVGTGANPTNLRIDNTAGVTLLTAKTINGTLALVNGYLTTTGTLLIGNSGTATTANGAFVNGQLNKSKNTTTRFDFPVGNLTGGLRIVGVTPQNTTTTIYGASFISADPRTVPNGNSFPGIQQISACEYWNVAQIVGAGSTPARVTLTWPSSATSCGSSNWGPYITQPSSLLVAHHNGTSWTNEGQSANTVVSGSALNGGTVTSNNYLSTFSPFTIGTTNGAFNPLPVTFDDVKAFEKGTGVQIEWSNLTEKDVLNYVVERSANGRDFTAISQLASRSNLSDKQSYLSFDGSPLSGTNYYRIKVVEIDGKIIYSKVLKVDIGKNVKGIILYPNPVVGSDISIGFTAAKGQYTLRVVNNAGQEVYTKQIVHPGGSINQTVTLPSALKTGVYNLMISGDNYRENKMFIMQ